TCERSHTRTGVSLTIRGKKTPYTLDKDRLKPPYTGEQFREKSTHLKEPERLRCRYRPTSVRAETPVRAVPASGCGSGRRPRHPCVHQKSAQPEKGLPW